MAIACDNTELVVGTYNMCLNDTDLGTTSGGVTISQANAFTEVRNDQSLTLQAKFKTQQDWTISATMMSVTLDKLRVYFGVKEGYNSGNSTLCFSEDVNGCSFPEEFTLAIEGPGPGCTCRNFYFPRVIITPDTVDYVIQRETPVEIPIEFTALASCPSGDIGCVTDTCDMLATDEDTLIPLVCAVVALPDYVAPV